MYTPLKKFDFNNKTCKFDKEPISDEIVPIWIKLKIQNSHRPLKVSPLMLTAKLKYVSPVNDQNDDGIEST